MFIKQITIEGVEGDVEIMRLAFRLTWMLRPERKPQWTLRRVRGRARDATCYGRS